jgi:hypothetical protein
LSVQGNEKEREERIRKRAVEALRVKTEKSFKHQTTKKRKKAWKRPEGKREEEREDQSINHSKTHVTLPSPCMSIVS